MESSNPQLILIIGGARSGKSRYALRLSNEFRKKAFIATGLPTDAEMEERIQKHRQERTSEWHTFEEPIAITDLLTREAAHFNLMLLDCLTFWVSNLLLKSDQVGCVEREISKLKRVLSKRECAFVIVSNEVGTGIVPENPLARNFRDLAGLANQQIAEIADRVILMVAGIPMEIK